MAVKKTTTAAKKPATAAKKTTTAAKKTTTTAAKKTTVTAAKKAAAPAKKAAAPAKTTTELSVTGNKKIGTLMKEFNKKFPYLRLGIFYSYARQQVAKGETITNIDVDKTLASVRRANSGGDISISGNKRVSSLEKEFDTVFGLYCQVCYTRGDGSRYYTGSAYDSMTLSALNKQLEAEGCKKGEWR